MTLPDLGSPTAFRKHINWDHPDLNERTKEGVQMELKAGPKEDHPEKLVHTIAAFANTLGGTIIVGVGEGGKKTGLTYAEGLVPVKNGDSLRGKMTKLIASRLDPSPPVRIHVLDIDEDGETNQVVVLQVQSSVRIIGCRGKETGHGLRYLYRTEHGNQDMTPMEVEAHILNPSRARQVQLEQALASFQAIQVVQHHREVYGDQFAPLVTTLRGYKVYALNAFGLMVGPVVTKEAGVVKDWELACVPYECVKLLIAPARESDIADLHIAGRIEVVKLAGAADDALYHLEFVPDIN